MRGLKLRSLGLGGEVYRRLGAVPQTTPPGEILVALQSGVIDGAEFVGPGTDIALGLYRVATLYYGPGFNKPNGTGECIVALKAWEALDSEGKAIIAHACAAEASFALAEMERLNFEALNALTTKDGVQAAHVPQRSRRRRAHDLGGRARRTRGAQRQGAKSPRFLHGVSRARRGLVAHLDPVGAGGEGGVTAASLPLAPSVSLPRLRGRVGRGLRQ